MITLTICGPAREQDSKEHVEISIFGTVEAKTTDYLTDRDHFDGPWSMD